MATQPKVPPTLTNPAPEPAPALRVSQVTVVVGLIDQYDAPQHFLDEQGNVRQFQFIGGPDGSCLEKAAGFLAAVPHMLAAQSDPAPVTD